MFALNEGDAIRGDASAATVVDYTLHGIVGVEVTALADGQLASSEGTLYTAIRDGIAVTAICLVNTDSTSRTVNLYKKSKGGTSRRIIPKNIALAAGYSLYANGIEIKIVDTSGQELIVTSMVALDDTPVDGEITEAITSNWAYDHVAAADPHTGYQKESEKGAASGYASLDGSTKVTEQPASITDHLEATPSNSETTKAPDSNWAYDHALASTAVHGVTGTILGSEDVDDTPVNGATAVPPSSNWAFDTAARLDDVSQGDVTSSRAIDGTAYRNTSGKIRIVTVQCYCETGNAAGYSRVTFHCDTNATPTTQIGLIGLDVTDEDSGTATHKAYLSFTFVVVPNNYYKATASADAATTPVLGDWFEWDLL